MARLVHKAVSVLSMLRTRTSPRHLVLDLDDEDIAALEREGYARRFLGAYVLTRSGHAELERIMRAALDDSQDAN